MRPGERTHPDARQLLWNWVVLVCLTLLSMSSALLDADSWEPLPLGAALLVLAATLFKCRQILWVYLNLRAAGRNWRVLLACLALGCVGVIAAAVLVTPPVYGGL